MAIEIWYPFYLVDRVTLDASGIGSAVLKISAGDFFEGDEIDFILSAGTFNIIAIKDQGGKGYTNAGAADPLPSAAFLTSLEQRTNFHKFATPLVLLPEGQLQIDFSGGTASATIDVIIKGKKRVV